jgi:hypothetical protein
MPANDESPQDPIPTHLTNHAKERMVKRGLRAEAIHAALTYGRVVYVRGAHIYAIGRKEISRYATQGIDLSAYDGVQVVTIDNVVITAYRNRSFNGLKDRHISRRSSSSHRG